MGTIQELEYRLTKMWAIDEFEQKIHLLKGAMEKTKTLRDSFLNTPENCSTPPERIKQYLNYFKNRIRNYRRNWRRYAKFLNKLKTT